MEGNYSLLERKYGGINMGHSITVLGLGAGDINQLPLGIYKQLISNKRVFLRTKEHPVVDALQLEGMEFKSFDYIYEQHDQFEEVYEEITSILFQESKLGDLIYAVPGHPLVAEKTVQLLLQHAADQNVNVKIGGGQSFIDALFTAVEVDPIEGFQLLDGTDLEKDDIRTNQHVIIGQVYDAFIASDVKLTLMEKYPDEHKVAIVVAAGSSEETVTYVPLYELDRQFSLNNLTSLYVPPLAEEDLREFSTLRKIIKDLRGPNGCPWDKEQTAVSLKKYVIEECYELLAAIDEDDIDHMIEELGDVLLQVMLQAQIGEDDGMFAIEDVIQTISEKMIRRHPHVFGDAQVSNADEVMVNWQKIKATERTNEQHVSLLEGVGKGYPALIRAYELQKKAAKVGFDWADAKDAWSKVQEEIREFEIEMENHHREKQLDEFGDMMFALINVGRLLKIYPEEALTRTNEKFIRRFQYIEKRVNESGQPFEHFTLEELDQFWTEAKDRE